MFDPIMAMNMKVAIAQQDNKCLKCKKELPAEPKDQIFYHLDQAKDISRVYCMSCGKKLSIE